MVVKQKDIIILLMSSFISLDFQSFEDKKCIRYSSNRQKEKHRLQVPDTITSWLFEGVSINPKHGLALSNPIQLHAFQHFFVDFTLPYSVVRGEQVKVPLVLHNYLRSCVRVGARYNMTTD